MNRPECARFLALLDHAEKTALEDPHAGNCDSCGAARRAVVAMRQGMDVRSPAPDGFAARVATLAWMDARDRTASRRIAWSSIARPVVASALGIGFAFAAPVIQQNLAELPQSTTSIGSLQIGAFHLAAMALAGAAFLALAAARLARRRI